MEIKLDLGLRTISNIINMIWNLNRERMMLLVISLLLAPFVISSIWTLAVIVVYKLFCLLLTAGLFLIIASLCYQGYMTAFNNGPTDSLKPCRSLLDIILSVLFEAGVQFPRSLWNTLMAASWNVGATGTDGHVEDSEPETPIVRQRQPDCDGSGHFNPFAAHIGSTSASSLSYSNAPGWSASTHRRRR